MILDAAQMPTYIVTISHCRPGRRQYFPRMRRLRAFYSFRLYAARHFLRFSLRHSHAALADFDGADGPRLLAAILRRVSRVNSRPLITLSESYTLREAPIALDFAVMKMRILAFYGCARVEHRLRTRH